MPSRTATRRALRQTSSTLRGSGRRKAHHAAGQLEAGQAGKGLAVGCVHRGITATGQDIGSRAGDLFALHEQGERCVSGIQRAGNHLGAFGNKDAFFRFQTIAQLRLRQAGIDIQLRCGKVCDLDNIRHKEVLLWKSFFLILTQPVRECKVRAGHGPYFRRWQSAGIHMPDM